MDYIDKDMKSYCINNEVCLPEYILKYFEFARNYAVQFVMAVMKDLKNCKKKSNQWMV